MEDRIDMVLTARELGVKSIPVNLLNPIPGTPYENRVPLDGRTRRLDLPKLYLIQQAKGDTYLDRDFRPDPADALAGLLHLLFRKPAVAVVFVLLFAGGAGGYLSVLCGGGVDEAYQTGDRQNVRMERCKEDPRSRLLPQIWEALPVPESHRLPH